MLSSRYNNYYLLLFLSLSLGLDSIAAVHACFNLPYISTMPYLHAKLSQSLQVLYIYIYVCVCLYCEYDNNDSDRVNDNDSDSDNGDDSDSDHGSEIYIYI